MNGSEKTLKRYQDASFLVKVWRLRHYITIPFKSLNLWFYNRKEFSFKVCWKIATGITQVKMDWVFAWEDVREQINSLLEDREREERNETNYKFLGRRWRKRTIPGRRESDKEKEW